MVIHLRESWEKLKKKMKIDKHYRLDYWDGVTPFVVKALFKLLSILSSVFLLRFSGHRPISGPELGWWLNETLMCNGRQLRVEMNDMLSSLILLCYSVTNRWKRVKFKQYLYQHKTNQYAHANQLITDKFGTAVYLWCMHMLYYNFYFW